MLPGQQALLNDFRQLTNDLQKEGFFDPAPLHIAYRIAELFVMHVLAFWLIYQGYALPGLTVLGIVCGRCGWLMHEGGHYSLTGHIPTDKMLQVVCYGVGCGMSGSWWRNQHNKHHSMPQKVGHDVDLNTLPLVAFTSKIVKRCGVPMKYWLRFQAYMFPVITTLLVALGWQFYLHPRHVLRTKNVPEILSLVARYVAWTLLITRPYGLAVSAAFYLIHTWIAANYIFINFAVSHTHLPVVPKEDTQVDWVRYAAVHTMNAKSGPFNFIDWWMSYLNFQIEHHLFPSMPQFRHPIVSKRVRALFEKHGLVYDSRSYADAMVATFKNLDKVGYDVFLG